MKYVAMKYEQNPYFKKPDWRKRLRDWFWVNDGWAYVGSVVMLLVFIVYLWIRSQWMWVTQVEISPTQYVDRGRVEQIVDEALNKKDLLVVPVRFYPFLNTQDIEESIRKEFADTFAFESISTTKTFPNTLTIEVSERVPGLIYIVGDNYYYLDEEGYITEYVADAANLNPQFPRIRDRNTERTVEVGQQVLKPNVISFIIELNKDFTPETGLDMSEYALQKIVCKEKQFVAEEIIQTEIEGSENEEIKKQKREVLDQLQNEEISIDESLALLEDIKKAERELQGEDSDGYIQLQATFVDKTCNYVNVLQDVTVVTQLGVEVYFDSTIGIANQLRNLKSTLASAEEENLQYIDVRFTDRSYYK